jgi:eukaryotic-like serine/threonine-protein kinase
MLPLGRMSVSLEESRPAPFGRYVIRERLARGGMGEVFRAVAVGADGFEKAVVIKRLLPKFAGRTDISNLFSAEAKLMTRLIHPNIVEVFDFGRGESDDYFLVMELVQGLDLGRFAGAYRQRGETVPLPIVIYIVSQVLRGLACAHGTFSADGARLVHRDISPGNVLLSSFGEVKVADFGVALVAAREKEGGETGVIAGKPGYIAPEQFAGGSIDERADLYSTGVLFFEALVGMLPEVDPRTGLCQKSEEALAALAPEPVAAVVRRALLPDPKSRFADARAMSQAVTAPGQPIATPDDLADAVSHAMGEVPTSARRVVLLSADAPADDPIVGTELSRTDGRGEGRFTVRVADEVAPVPVAPGRKRKIGLALIAAGFVLGVGALLAARRPRSAAPLPVASSLPAVRPLAPEPVVSSLPEPSASAPAVAPLPQRVRGPKPETVASTKIEVAGMCRGSLHVFAGHGWVLKGGPATVQAPGRYDWPCGTYGIAAVSRTDPSVTRRTSVTVRDGATSVLDLR